MRPIAATDLIAAAKPGEKMLLAQGLFKGAFLYPKKNSRSRWKSRPLEFLILPLLASGGFFCEEIWAQGTGLAKSPWPSFRFNSGHTAQTYVTGPNASTLEELQPLRTVIHLNSSPVIATDGTIIFSSLNTDKIYAFDKKRIIKPGFPITAPDNNVFAAPPVVDNAGVIYIGSNHGFLFAFDFQGLRWQYPKPGKEKLGAFSQAAVLDDSGNIYAATDDG